MTRVLIEELLLFALPFALFALWLTARRRTLGAHAENDHNAETNRLCCP